MAARTGPTDGKRFKRATPAKVKKRHAANGPVMNRGAGEHMLTPALLERIVRLIQVGNYAEVAARSVGINPSTYYDWLTRGGRGEEPFKQLAEAVEKASAEAEARDVAIIGKAAETHWQAAAWRLERKNPKRWGRKDGLEITGDDQKPVAVTVIKFGDDEVEFT